MKYRVMKFVDGDWWEWGTFDTVDKVGKACCFLGSVGVTQVKVEVIE